MNSDKKIFSKVWKDLLFSNLTQQVLTFLINGRDFQYTLSDVQEGLKGWASGKPTKMAIWKCCKKLNEVGMITKIKHGKEHRYQVDMKNDAVKQYKRVLRQYLNELLERL